MAVLSRLRVPAQPLLLHLTRPPSRAYGSAAALHDNDFYYQYDDAQDDEAKNDNRAETQDSEGWVPRRGVQWVILGDPMVRRQVYAQKLSHLLGVPHISMGSLLRHELYPHSSLYNQIASAVNEGKLVPEDVIFGLLAKRLEEGHNRGESGFILDGIPRTRVQAEILDQMADIDLVVNLQSTEESLWKKYLGNGLPSASEEFSGVAKTSFNLGSASPNSHVKSSGVDTQASLKEKFRTYADQNKPLEDYYRKQRKLLDFQVAGAPGDCWQGLLAALHLPHMHAIGASQKLTA